MKKRKKKKALPMIMISIFLVATGGFAALSSELQVGWARRLKEPVRENVLEVPVRIIESYDVIVPGAIDSLGPMEPQAPSEEDAPAQDGLAGGTDPSLEDGIPEPEERNPDQEGQRLAQEDSAPAPPEQEQVQDDWSDPVDAEGEPAADRKLDGIPMTEDGKVDYGKVIPKSVTGEKFPGNATLVDYQMYDSIGVMFLTIVTSDDSVFYLNMDFNKKSDNVYLMEILSKDRVTEAVSAGSKPKAVAPPTEPPAVAPQNETPAPAPKSKGSNVALALLAFAGTIAAALIYRKRRKAAKPANKDENDFGDEALTDEEIYMGRG